jgi:hypothetical protein
MPNKFDKKISDMSTYSTVSFAEITMNKTPMINNFEICEEIFCKTVIGEFELIVAVVVINGMEIKVSCIPLTSKDKHYQLLNTKFTQPPICRIPGLRQVCNFYELSYVEKILTSFRLSPPKPKKNRN